MYYSKLIIGDQEYRLAVNIVGYGPPTVVGDLGMLYVDLDSETIYKCFGDTDWRVAIHTPDLTIVDGIWHIDGVSTGVDARGIQGEKGDPGERGLQGEPGVPGEDGRTPVITIENGNWYIDGVDTGVLARGNDGASGKSAYQYAKDGGYTGTEEEFAAKLAQEFPTELPNPHALTINGTTYDGSEEVNLEITGGATGEVVALGQTPLTLTKAANIKLVADGECSYEVESSTVADVETGIATSTLATLTQNDEYIEFKSTGGAAWYASHVDVTMGGLVVGEKYRLILDFSTVEFDSANYIGEGHYILKDAENNTLVTAVMGVGTTFHNYEFTATTENVVLVCYPAGNSVFVSGNSIARATDIYINRSSDGAGRTEVFNKTGNFTDSFILGDVPKGVTIESTPSCVVYGVVEEDDADGGLASPMAGKTVVCFGDSLFGMFTGSGSAPAYAEKITGATVHNVGFGGCRMSVHPTTGYAEFCMWALAKAIAENDWTAQDAAASKGSENFPEQLAILKSIDFNEVDSIIIHYGTNDFNGAPIDNKSNPTDYTTLCGALRYSVETLLSAYPRLKIFISLPAFRYWTEGDTVIYSDEKKNANGDTLPDFVKAMWETAKEYKLPVIDCYYGLGINKSNATTFLSDGVHHDVAGRKRFGEYIGAKLISNGDTSLCVDANNASGGAGGTSIDVTATVGQTIIVKEVDENGKPTKWESADYQPRTHWSEEAVILPETTVEIDPDAGAGLLPDMAILAGDNLTVKYNGAEYKCTCADMDGGMLAFGNYGVTDEENPVDTGEPFVVLKADGGDGTLIWACVPLDGSASFTLSVIGEVHHPLPEKYLPYKCVDVNFAISPNADGSFEVTADMEATAVFRYAKTPNTVVRAVCRINNDVRIFYLSHVDSESAIFRNYSFSSSIIGYTDAGGSTGVAYSTGVIRNTLKAHANGEYTYEIECENFPYD